MVDGLRPGTGDLTAAAAQREALARQRELAREAEAQAQAMREAQAQAALEAQQQTQTKPSPDTLAMSAPAKEPATPAQHFGHLGAGEGDLNAAFDAAYAQSQAPKDVAPAAPDGGNQGTIGGMFGGLAHGDPKHQIDGLQIDPKIPTHSVPDRQDEIQARAQKDDIATLKQAKDALGGIPKDDPKRGEYEQKVKDLNGGFEKKWGAVIEVPSPPPDGPFHLLTPDGKRVEVEIKPDNGLFGTGLFADHNKYEVKIDGVKTSVEMENGVDKGQKLNDITKNLSDMPRDMQKSVHTIKVHKGPDPDDKDYQKQFNDPNFHVGATGGGGTIDFYNDSVDQGTLVHEAAHNFADDKFGNTDPRKTSNGNSDGKAWDDAVKGDADTAKQQGRADGGYPSDYGKYVRDRTDSDGEDFAEATRVYLKAKEQGPAELQRVREQFPHRAKLLDDLFAQA